MLKLEIRPSHTPAPTEVFMGQNLFKQITEYCHRLHRRVFIIADKVLKDLYGTKLAQLLKADLITIPGGEKAKSSETLENLMKALFERDVGRDSLIIALGGGVITDLVGFVSSIYMRGIELILFPTSLVAMVDAAIGGKTAIDTSFGKNLVGTFYHPKAVFIDFDTLLSLPEKEWFNGRAEILKTGLICDASIWDAAKENGKDPKLVVKTIQRKIEMVEKDPLEKGIRRSLNFGHTIGHALEVVAHYEMPHGLAVAIGCIVESHLSMQLGYLTESDFEKIESLYGKFALKLPKSYSRQKLLQAMYFDKKKAMGKLRFVLIDRIGHTMPWEGDYCRPVLLDELESTLQWMEYQYG